MFRWDSKSSPAFSDGDEMLTPNSRIMASDSSVSEEDRRYKSKLVGVCTWILTIELMERLCFYTFFGSQPYFLETVGYSAAEAGAINNIMGMFCYLSPILGGYLSEAGMGRFKTIMSFSLIYLLGLFCATFAAHPRELQRELYIVGVLGLVALGTGGIKACVCPFGADQFDTANHREAKEQEKWFYLFYIAINVGALVAYGYLTTLATNGLSPLIPREYGYFSAYLVAGSCMLIGLLFFLGASRKYRRVAPEGTNLASLCSYIYHSSKNSLKGKVLLFGWCVLAAFVVLSVVQAFILNRVFSFITYGLGILGLSLLIPGYINTHFMRDCHEREDLSLEDARDLLRIIPTLFTGSIGFNLLYNAMNYYNIQACQFDLIVGSQQISGSFFNVADYIAIILFTSIWEKYLYPCLGRMKRAPLTRHQKIFGGFSFGFLSLTSAIFLELKRRASDVLTDEPFSNCAPPGTYMSDISGFWMFIPFSLTGIGEIMVNPVLFYFVYEQSPPSCSHIAHALFLLTTALSNGLTAVMGIIMAPDITNDLNEGRLELFYTFSIASALVCLVAFYYVGTCFEEKEYRESASETTASNSARALGASARSLNASSRGDKSPRLF